MALLMLLISLFLQNFLSLSFSLNSQGLALLRFRERVVRDPYGALSNWEDSGSGTDIDPCSWFGVECSSDGQVVILDLRDLCLGGKLAPELGKLPELKSIILRNNSFSGTIPKELGGLKKLQVLDLGCNNFSGPVPSDLGNNPSLTTLLLDNNQYLGSISPELYELKTLSELQVEKDQRSHGASKASWNRGLFSWRSVLSGVLDYRRLLEQQRNGSTKEKGAQTPKSFGTSKSSVTPSSENSSPSPSPSPPPSPSPSSIKSPSSPPPSVVAPPPKNQSIGAPAPSTPIQLSKSQHHIILVLAGIIGGSALILISAIGVIFFRSSKVVTVKPWVTGLSGQLQKAFVTGVPKLKRAELEAACEDFSNIIGSFSDGTVYKGTLSSGVEIAVTSTSIKSHAYWSKNLESQFRKKIDTLSKVNHKNFVNLIGFCAEDAPFTRMMVFEYAPNGTLFEHLHIQEAEHLDWGMRLRIAMGMAYCLEHMHQLTPPVAHKNLQSSSVHLTEDYASKISDFGFWNDITAADNEAGSLEIVENSATDLESNVCSFGVILYEMVTGRIPYSGQNGFLVDWASKYLRREASVKEIVDPTLKSFQENELVKLLEVIRSCVHPDPKQRPTMRDITAKLKEITAMGPDGATPKLSPLWWAELEIMSTDES